jgi:hypothetical protein
VGKREVGGVPIHTHIQELHAKHAFVPKVANLPVDTLTGAAEIAYNNLAAIVAESKTWKMPIMGFAERRRKFLAATNALVSQKHKCQLWQDSFAELKEEIAEAKTSQLDVWRKGRNKISGLLRSMKIQPSVAKQAADYMHTLASTEEEALRQVRRVTDFSNHSALLYIEPVFVPASSQDQSIPEWLRQARTDYVASTSALDTKFHKVEGTLMLGRRPRHHCSLEGILPPLKFGAADEGVAYGDPVVVNAVFHVSEAGACDVSPQAFPWDLQRIMITQHHGSSFILVIDEKGSVGKDVPAWVSSCHHTALASYPCFNLDPGDAMIVPAGHFPVIVTLPSLDEQKVDKKQRVPPPMQYVSHAVRPFYDAVWDAKLAAPTTLRLVQGYLAAAPVIPGSIKKLTTAWRSALEQVYDAHVQSA